MADKERRILILRAVVGVGIQDQLRIRDVLRKRERVIVGTMISLLPFTTSVGCLIVFKSA